MKLLFLASIFAGVLSLACCDAGSMPAVPSPDASSPIVRPDAAMAGAGITLAPGTLTFFSLPINSDRHAVGGLYREAGLCVTLVWDYSNNGKDRTRHCDDFFPGFPYVVVKPAAAGHPCNGWDYGGNVKLVAARGCVDFHDFGAPSTDLIDVSVDVDGDLLRGTVRVSNR